MSAERFSRSPSTEYYIRGRGYIKKIEDIENIVLKVENGTPVYLKNVGKRPSRRRYPAWRCRTRRAKAKSSAASS